jgi:subtilisin family serine protease
VSRLRSRPRLRLVVPWVLVAGIVAVFSASGAFAGATSSVVAVPDGTAATAVPLGVKSGSVRLAVNLSAQPLARVAAAGHTSKAAQHAQLAMIKLQQAAVTARLKNLGGKPLAHLTNALNTVVVSIDRRQISRVEAIAGVNSVRILRNYQESLAAGDDTVSYIGAAAAQAAGKDGGGVTVAILDTGIDYTHQDLGGSGSAADFTKAYGTTLDDPRNTTIDPSVFPTSKVIGGYDFIGEHWPNTVEHPDPNPIDCSPSSPVPGCQGGHGSHVADILAGVAASPGTAPGAKILSYKVCSTLSTACDGLALLEAVDRAMDPNQDGNISDHADVLSLSLGSAYGQIQDDLTLALDNAVDAGAIAVAAAGNNGNLPYVVSSPSIGPNVISVAQTQVPSAKGYAVDVNTPSGLGPFTNTAALDWAPVGNTDITGDIAYVGRGCPAGSITASNPDDPYLANPSGKIALIDRGACNVSAKVDRAARAGAIGVLIGLVAPGDPISFSQGSGSQFVPSLVLTQADANAIKTALGCFDQPTPNCGAHTVNVTYGPSTAIALVGSMASTSARGPSYSDQSIKPDIGAPGAAVSANAGSGNGTSAFGGTSGATPMISGSAAIIKGAFPNRSPFEIKSLLMNTAETNITTNPLTLGSELAPITRIGGGEVRVNAALNSTTAAWDDQADTGSLSFGYLARSTPKDLTKKVDVRNYSGSPITYSISPTFRFADDAASGAVTIDAPDSITVPANSTRSFDVHMHVDPSKLPFWTLNGGPNGGNGELLNLFEYDGYLWLDGGSSTSKIHLAWQVLPHRSANVKADPKDLDLGPANHPHTAKLNFQNKSHVLDGAVEAFSLTGTSPQIDKKFLPAPGDNFAVIDLKSVGVREPESGLVQFGIDTYGARSHPNYPAEFDVYIDSNGDGTPDYIVFNLENGGFGTSGQNVDEVFNLATGHGSVFFFTDADLDSGNAILTAPMSAVGLTNSSKFNFAVFAFDNYFTGNLTDAIGDVAEDGTLVNPMTYTLGTPRFQLSGPSSFTVSAGGHTALTASNVAGGDLASPSQLGFQFLYRDAKASGGPDPSKKEGQAVLVKP